ncbi:hypothetical protein ACFW9I_33895 [[Kitasatospora] papulosa]|uniref:hypothetical protein n=1 Tax=[Kitasatospora] papulosa TaxID=1464011 RepID=UPI0036C68950
MTEWAGPTGVAGRLGGDEFAALARIDPRQHQELRLGHLARLMAARVSYAAGPDETREHHTEARRFLPRLSRAARSPLWHRTGPRSRPLTDEQRRRNRQLLLRAQRRMPRPASPAAPDTP